MSVSGQWAAKAGWVWVERLSRELQCFVEKVSGGISKMKSVGCNLASHKDTHTVRFQVMALKDHQVN